METPLLILYDFPSTLLQEKHAKSVQKYQEEYAKKEKKKAETGTKGPMVAGDYSLMVDGNHGSLGSSDFLENPFFFFWYFFPSFGPFPYICF